MIKIMDLLLIGVGKGILSMILACYVTEVIMIANLVRNQTVMEGKVYYISIKYVLPGKK